MKIPVSVRNHLRELADDRKSGGVKILAAKVKLNPRTLHRVFKEGKASASTLRLIARAFPNLGLSKEA